MDIQALRADTPGVSERIHLNNAGASLMPRPVIEAVKEHLDLEARIGGYEASDQRVAQIEAARATVAELLGGTPANIAFLEHATAAFAAGLSSVPFRTGDKLVTTRNDYVSYQLMYLSLERRLGIRVIHAPDAPEGGVDVLALEEQVHRHRPRVVAVTHVPTSSGLVQDVESIGEVCRKKGALFMVDACQSVGQMVVDARALQCDFLSGTARKFLRGPRGMGFLYVSDRALEEGLEPLFIDMRGADWTWDDLYQPAPDAKRFESWEFAYALVLGLGAAARYALDVGIDQARARSWTLAAQLRERLAELPGVRVLDRGAVLCAIVTAHVAGHTPGALVRTLRERGINTSAIDRTSAVLDFDEKGVEGALRISPHYYNTESDIEAVVDALRELVPG